MRLLVCGGRDYANISAVNHALGAVHRKYKITVIIEGGAYGADRLAREWAQRNNITVVTFNADWHKHGKAAGYIRNSQMLTEGKPDAVVAFPGGRGTNNMIKQACDAGVTVWLYSKTK